MVGPSELDLVRVIEMTDRRIGTNVHSVAFTPPAPAAFSSSSTGRRCCGTSDVLADAGADRYGRWRSGEHGRAAAARGQGQIQHGPVAGPWRTRRPPPPSRRNSPSDHGASAGSPLEPSPAGAPGGCTLPRAARLSTLLLIRSPPSVKTIAHPPSAAVPEPQGESPMKRHNGPVPDAGSIPL